MKRAICHNPKICQTEDFCIARNLGYKCTFWENVAATKKLLFIFSLRHNMLKFVYHGSVKFFSLLYKIVYQWGVTNCYFISDMLPQSSGLK